MYGFDGFDPIRQRTISEIFDGEPTHAPRGAPSQAWNVACVLEAWVKLVRVRRTIKQKEEA